MTTKEKKEYGIFAVLLVITLGVIYFNFLKPKPAPLASISALPADGTAPSAGPAAAIANGSAPSTGADVVTASPGTAAASVSSLLPNGSSLPVDILQQKPFSDFNPPIYPVVLKSDVGSSNVFGK
ncbi:MAG: hypothetical protein JWO40_274 [Candidatus Doudnabacteria bacterium]|nr:hypothetical protein [Candidatus Doudnabacteria bacterium]